MTYQSRITASTYIDPCIIQLHTLMATEKYSEANSRIRGIATVRNIIPSTIFDIINERNGIPFLPVRSVQS